MPPCPRPMQPAKDKPWKVYVLRDPRSDEVRYVGVTTADPKRRLQLHCTDLERRRSHRKHWVKQLMALSLLPVLEVIESGIGNWAEAEKRWIAHYRSIGARLTNATDGGEGTVGHVPSPETRDKLRRRMLGNSYRLNRKHSPETRAKMGASQMGRRVSAETRRKMSIAMKGRVPSEETRAKLRRHKKSEKHCLLLGEASARLTAEQVTEIRRRYAAGEMQKALAVEFGVVPRNIQAICLGKTWKHLPMVARDHRTWRSICRSGEKNPAAKLTAEKVVEVRHRWAAGESQMSLGREIGLSYQNVCDLVHGHTWKHLPVIPRDDQGRLRASRKGRPRAGDPSKWKPGPETRAKLSALRKGRPLSPETCDKMSRSMIAAGVNVGERSAKAKLTTEQVMEIRHRWAAGESPKGLAADFGVQGQTISSICRGAAWKHLPIVPRSEQRETVQSGDGQRSRPMKSRT